MKFLSFWLTPSPEWRVLKLESKGMHIRRFLCFVLGLWVGGGLLMGVAAFRFHAVDRLMAQAPADETSSSSRSHAQSLLRDQVAQQNRAILETWQLMQLAAGGLFFFYLLFGTKERKLTLLFVLAMVLIVIVQEVLLKFSGPIAGSPLAALSNPQDSSRPLRLAYFGLEFPKNLLALLLAGIHIFSRHRHRQTASGSSSI
jgi:hypothetical protein